MSSNLPNLMAEIQYSGISVVTLAEHAGVSKEVMLEVLNGEDSLALDEFMRLADLLREYSIPGDVYDLKYLFNRELLMVDVRHMESMEEISSSLMGLANALTNPSVRNDYAWDIRRLQKTAKDIQEQPIMPYAKYRHFGHEALSIESCLLNRECIRTKKLTEI